MQVEIIKNNQNILKEIECKSEIITVYNKCDTLQENIFPVDAILISAKNNIGLDNLKKVIEEKLFGDYINLNFNVTFDKYNAIQKLKKYCENYTENYIDDYVSVDIVVAKKHFYLFKDFI